MGTRRFVFLFLLLSGIIFLFSCTTSRGNLFKRTLASDKDSTTYTEDDDEKFNLQEEDAEEEEEENRLTIKSRPHHASVYIDDVYYGKTPLVIEYLTAGDYRLEIRLEGYRIQTDWLYYNGSNMTYETELVPIIGYLDIHVEPPDALIVVGGEYITGPHAEIPIGEYLLRVRYFGYTEYTGTVVIEEGKTTSRDIALEKAAFSATGLSANRIRFNPSNPGSLGTTIISFHVTNRGTAGLLIIDGNGNEVLDYPFPPFATWEQEFEWNGKTGGGKSLPDGEYTVRISARGDDGNDVVLSMAVVIDRSITISYLSIFNGMSGLLYTPTAETLPSGGFQLSTVILAHLEEGDDEILMRAPVVLSGRFGCGESLEVDYLAAMILGSGERSIGFASIGVKKLLFTTKDSVGFSGGIYAKASYHDGTGSDTLSNFLGISGGVPLQFHAGPFSFVLSPEIVLSVYRVTYTSDYDEESGFYSWGYVRGGLLLDMGTVIAGLSCAVRTLPFSEGFGFDYPALGAAECHFMIPDTSIYVSLAAATEFVSIDNFYVMGGLGLGVIF
ncbi:MAG: PEGA domain-containing protein [Spirochaetales bacterium]|nr:PEGA domain-containing protein [Spirochaetales bacterium]